MSTILFIPLMHQTLHWSTWLCSFETKGKKSQTEIKPPRNETEPHVTTVPLQPLCSTRSHHSAQEMSSQAACKPCCIINPSILSQWIWGFFFFYWCFNSSLTPSKQQCYWLFQKRVGLIPSMPKGRGREIVTGNSLNLLAFSPQHHCETFLWNIRFELPCFKQTMVCYCTLLLKRGMQVKNSWTSQILRYTSSGSLLSGPFLFLFHFFSPVFFSLPSLFTFLSSPSPLHFFPPPFLFFLLFHFLFPIPLAFPFTFPLPFPILS